MNKSTLIAVAVLGLLVVGVIWNQRRAPERGITRVTFADLDVASVDRIEVSGKNAVKLNKDGKLWKVESGKEADANAVTRLVEAVPKIVSTDLTTTDSEKFSELEVDDEKGTRVQVYAGKKELADFVVGKSGKGGGSHVRVGDEVYTVKGVYSSTFSREASSWLERKLFADKVADVNRVEIARHGEAPYTLVKTDGKWALADASVLPAGFRFDSDGANSLVSALVNARAKDILDADPGVETTKLDETVDTFAFDANEGEGDAKTTVRREVKVGTALEDKSVYARVSGKTDIITLAEHTVKSLRKVPTDFRDLKIIELDKEKVSEVSIVDGSTRLTLEKQGAEWKVANSSAKIPEDFVLDPTAVIRRLSGMANARATKVAEGVTKSAAGLSRPLATVTAKLDDGSKVTLAFGKAVKDEDRDMIYVSGNIDDAVYLATEWTRKNLAGGLDSFKKTEAPAGGMDGMGGMPNLDPETLKNLPPDVRASLMQQLQQKQQQQQLMENLQRQQAKKGAE